MRWMVVLVAGCNGILGVHDFPASDAAAPTADVTVHLFSDRFTGEPLTRDRQSLAPDRVTLLDGSPLAFETLADGSFQTQLPEGMPYQVRFGASLLETDRAQLQLSSIAYGAAGHPPPTSGTSARVSALFGGNPISAYRMIATPTTGVAIMTAGSSGLTADWSTQVPLLAADDRFYIAEYVANGAFASMVTYATGSVTLAPGVETGLGTPTVTTLATTSQAALAFAFSSLGARVRAAVPDATEVDPHLEILAMQPALEHHLTQLLAYDATPPTDGPQSISFGNPFPSTTPVAMVQELALANGHLAELFLISPLDASGTAAFTQDCGIPSAPTIDGSSFDSSNVELDRSKPVRITWTVDAPVQLAQVGLIDAASGPVFAGYTTRDEISLDPTLFLLGHSYYVQIFTASGYPDGDFTTANPAIALGAYRSDPTLIAN